ncbi:MAG: thiamine pyrophosphate-dependent dehydrogenase E1 component subunit alpha [Sinobacteraceae bacterium]|nr:thiamine pyrophosphate-dependent dehydrogenase E1 component subunit alpha [Nevskiaceae bacterium]
MTRDQLLCAYRRLRLLREFEERTRIEFQTGQIAGFTHLYAGMEAIAVGVCEHLTDEDKIISTHRGHGHCLAKGCDPVAMMKELWGSSEGLCGGKGGTMHIADFSRGMLGANAVVGAGAPIAVGAALAASITGASWVAVSFVGDGGTNIGSVYEAMNMAVVLRLPKIFVIEDNGWGEMTPIGNAAGNRDLAARAAAMGMPAVSVDGTDFFAVHTAAGVAISRARRGEGPSTIVASAPRFYGHHEGDPQLYRSREEVAELRRKDDCLPRFIERVTATGDVTMEDLGIIDADIARLMDSAVEQSKAAPRPTADDVLQHVYIRYR